MKKRMAATIMALGLAGIMMTGCGLSTSFSSTKTTTTTNADGSSVTTTTTTSSGKTSDGSHTNSKTTETVTTDADGNTTSVATTEDENGTVVRYEKAAFNVVNDLDFDIKEMYLNFSDADTWGENAISEDSVFPVGNETGDLITFTYDSGHTLIDIAVVDADGASVTFENVDVAASKDPSHIEVDLQYDAEADAYVAVVC